MLRLRLFPSTERAYGSMCWVSRDDGGRPSNNQHTFFFSVLLLLLHSLRLLSMLFLCIVLSSQQQQPLSAIDRMVCRRSHRRASTKLFEKISLVALCICPFDDDTYHLSLARIFSTNVCQTKRSAARLCASTFFLLLASIWSMWHSDCAVRRSIAATLRDESIIDEEKRNNIIIIIMKWSGLVCCDGEMVR